MVLLIMVVFWLGLAYGLPTMFTIEEYHWLAGLLFLTSGVGVGLLGYHTRLRGWYGKGMWLFALFAVIGGVPLALQTGAGYSVHMPSTVSQMYVLAAAAAAPCGVVLGVYRVWLAR